MKNQEIRLSIEGMGCASCVGKIEKKLAAVDGIVSANINLVDRTARVEARPDTSGTIEANIIDAIESAGSYHAKILVSAADESKKHEAEAAHLQYRIKQSALAILTGFPLMAASMLDLLPSLDAQGFWLLITVATLGVMAYSGSHYFQGAWNGLKHKNTSMDTLVAMGTGVAWLYSMAVVVFPELIPEASRHVYFEAALIVIALVNIGHVLEARARGKTNQAIEKLLSLQAKTARVLRDGKEVDIPIEDVAIGDVVRVRPGEKVPVDGNIIEGSSFIDESMLTGEPMPVAKSINDEVIAGTMNDSGTFLYTATRIGAETTLAQIIETVRRAQSAKPDIARLVDKVASIFVPIVLIVALSTALFWWLYMDNITLALVTSMSILLIACPCALGLATPISMIVGIGKAAEFGILIRKGEALERASHVTTIVLDKTGTITEGKPQVTDIITEAISEDDALLFAAAVEKGSEHPLGKAIVQAAEHKGLSIANAENFEASFGGGVSANVDGANILIGNQAFLRANSIKIDENWQNHAEKLAKQAKTPVFLAKDHQIVAIIAIADPIKSDAKAAIQALHHLGLKVQMLTGDHQQTALAVAKEVGIDDVTAEVKPDDKDNVIAKLQEQGETVAMVGDGINDAAALARADVGFAIAHGSDIAIESADVVLMRSSLTAIPDAIRISSATLTNIKQNLLGAFIYNTLAIPIAAGVLFIPMGILLNPMLAGAAMAMSSVTVVSNANRLRFFKV
ncbi:heavy metal translocating P-type ATPase [Ghiorsea bivora]|uniref:heavy metal translocating P-type ATPase n=1 Tax=Ghiorsea bivora TaxID=1485545 RepID=UPI00056F2321|nr:heavy metal translocating P-type ATPase [Ghiorsea bivora]